MRPLRLIWTTLAIGLLLAGSSLPARAQFETRSSASVGLFRPISVTVGDFNRDGNLDLAVVSYLPTGKVSIFLGNGDGTFRPGFSYAVAVQPFYAATASFRHNGTLDLVVGDSLSDDVYVMLGNGDGTFHPAVAYPTSGEPSLIATGDFNGDGRIDIAAVAGYGCDCLEVLPGNGDGTFGAPVIAPFTLTGYAMAVGDFNADGKLDVATIGATGFDVSILLGNGDFTFRQGGGYTVGESTDSIVAGYFNHDNQLDLAVSTLEGIGVSVLLGNGNGTFQEPVNYETWFPTSVAAGDFNGDGKLDLVASNSGSAANLFASTVSVFIGNGDGTFQTGVSYSAGRSAKYVAVGDFNGDQQPDFVVIDGLHDVAITLLNTGVAAFSPTTPIVFPFQLIGTTSAPQTVTLTNTGESALRISSINASGDFGVNSTCGSSIAPGANCAISVTFAPTSTATESQTVTIEDSASSKPQTIELTGAGTVAQFSPTALSFSPQAVGTTSPPQVVQLTNRGSKPLQIGSVVIHGYHPGDFSLTNTCPASLNPRATCTVSVTFTPITTGIRTAFIYFNDNGGGSPQTVALMGTGS
ncbi:MAG: FG-GAP-like repeat-containing protein [Candidatus Sulfotelmatobacter sp.]